MSIRPVDLQVLVQKSSEVNRVSNGSERHDASAQAFANVIKKEVSQQEQQVVHSHKTDKDPVDKDGKGGNAYSKKSRDKREEKKDESKQDKQYKETSMFDMKV